MKTLKSLAIVVLFTLLAGVTYATTYNVTHYEVKSSSDLSTVIKYMVKSDFVRLNNYFQQNNVDQLKERVDVEFYVTKDSKIVILAAKSDNNVASEYIVQLLNNKEIKATDAVVNQRYKIGINLLYKS